jgi:ATP-dependent Clp protease ATP-binding subunit ClpC
METPRAWHGRWSPAAREVLNRAEKEARGLGHDYVGTEHALLALASTEGGLAGEVLADLGVARRRMLATNCMKPTPHDHEPPECISLMPRLKQALENSRRIADGLGVEVADTEHLLAGILAVPDSMAVEILRRLKVRPKTVRANLAERLGIDPRRLGAPRRRLGRGG